MNAEIGATWLVEFVAESILQCAVQALTTPPPEEPDTPLPELTGVIGWWDASVFASLNLTGSIINTVADQSGNSNDLGAFGSNARPTYSPTGFNGKPAMLFSATSHSALSCSHFGMGAGDTLTIWVVGARVNNDQFGRAMSYTAPGASHDYDHVGSWACSFANVSRSIHLERNNQITPDSSIVNQNVPARWIGTIDPSGNMKVYTDGVGTSTTSSPGNWVTDGDLTLGVGKLVAAFWDGTIAECGVSTDFYDATAVAALDDYLKVKWGL